MIKYNRPKCHTNRILRKNKILYFAKGNFFNKRMWAGDWVREHNKVPSASAQQYQFLNHRYEIDHIPGEHWLLRQCRPGVHTCQVARPSQDTWFIRRARIFHLSTAHRRHKETQEGDPPWAHTALAPPRDHSPGAAPTPHAQNPTPEARGRQRVFGTMHTVSMCVVRSSTTKNYREITQKVKRKTRPTILETQCF